MRLPLYTKILGWFLLNLLLIAVGLVIFLQAHFGFGLDALLSGRAGDQVETASHLILGELRGRTPEQWSEVLHRYDVAYGVTFTLLGPAGEWLAGGLHEFPPGVRALVGRRPGPGPGPGPREGVPPGRPMPPRTLVQTADPLRYWALLRVDLPGRRPPEPPGTLVIESMSLSAGGLFFDVRPWLAVALAAVAGSALFWFPFVRRITGAIAEMGAGATRFAEGKFAEAVPVRSRDELGALAEEINRMAARLDGYVSGQRRFLGDIAHELCAPLARMQMALGILEERAAPAQRERLGDLREEADHMSALVNELMSFSKASLGGAAPELRPVDVRRIAGRVVQREAAGGVTLEMPAELPAMAEPELLERALANLVRNALRHAGAAGPIAIHGERRGSAVTVAVRDSGPGVPPEMLAQIFDPFFRVDTSRTRETGGVGLGLAIVKTCVTSCGGTVEGRNLSPRGFEVTIRLAAPGEPR
ncbi:MAG TPA: HAMP domain-containing sensor histidine kinase [Chthoniobacterales bacterium]